MLGPSKEFYLMNVNSHLRSADSFTETRILQANELTGKILDLQESYSKKLKSKRYNGTIPILMSADLNDLPKSTPYNIITHHPRLRLQSAYADPVTGEEPEFTNYCHRGKYDVQCTKDYMWHTKAHFVVEE